MEDEDQDTTPFWRRSGSDTPFSRSRRTTTTTVQIVFFSFIAFIFIFFIIPPFISTTSQIFRPHLVRKGWDSLNLVLVLFAIICGFLSRNSDINNNDDISTNRSSYEFDYKSLNKVRRSNPVTPRQWYDQGDRYSDQTVYNRFSRMRSMRSSSSYPDLRVCESSWGGDDEPWRFYDDTRVYDYPFDRSDQLFQGYRQWPEVKAEEDLIAEGGSNSNSGEEKVVYTFTTEPIKQATSFTPPHPSPPPRSPSPSPRLPSPPPAPSSSPPTKPVKRKAKRLYQDLAPNTERVEKVDLGVEASETPPPPIAYERSKKNKKKRGGATKDFLIALRRKKKKQRQKSVENVDILFVSPSSSVSQLPPRSPPPPPPPPPPPFFHGLFSSKKGKSKRIHSTPPPPPPPPPPRQRPSPSLEALASISKTQTAPMTSEKPKPPSRVAAFSFADEITTTGSESPLIPIPPPPPPPPFKMPGWRFVVHGDYARLVSISSSRSGSPDLDSAEDASDDGGGSPARLVCPSPDVDTKADNFIARFRAGLKLEKMNSVKEKQSQRGGKSNLGPGPKPEPDPTLGST